MKAVLNGESVAWGIKFWSSGDRARLPNGFGCSIQLFLRYQADQRE